MILRDSVGVAIGLVLLGCNAQAQPQRRDQGEIPPPDADYAPPPPPADYGPPPPPVTPP